MLENAVYSVISPESCAAIIWRDAGKAEQAAAALKLAAPDMVELGLIDGIIPEPAGGAHEDYDEAARLAEGAARSFARRTVRRSRPMKPCRSATRSSARWEISSSGS